MNAPFAPPTPVTLSLPVDGMTCASCVVRVERALTAVPGVTSATVNLATERAEVLSAAPIDRAALVAAVDRVGYTVPAQTVDLAIEGMTCASCVARVERALTAVPGVASANVNLATERATVTGTADAALLQNAVEAVGYGARLVQASAAGDAEGAARKESEEVLLRRDLLIAATLSLPVFALEMGSHLFAPIHHLIMNTIGMQTSWVLQFVLTTLVLMGPGRRFYLKGYPALWRLAPDMNSLVAVGTTAAFAYSVVATFLPGLLPPGTVNVYFEAAAVIVTLILLGRLLEARAKGRTSQAISRLVGLQPRTARVHRGDTVVEVQIADVRTGDLIDLRPGERVPVDGEVTAGDSWIDESMITGEPAPVGKSAGAAVTGGTVN